MVAEHVIFHVHIKIDEKTIIIHGQKSVKKLKEDIELKTGIPVDQQRLIYAGKQLKDEHDLDDYDIRTGHTIFMAGRLKGVTFVKHSVRWPTRWSSSKWR
jgi:large subunit ribosomal protein L40e/ubiquitin C